MCYSTNPKTKHLSIPKGVSAMPSITGKRGSNPNDSAWFTGEALARLAAAHKDVSWLLDRGYKTDSIIEFTGNRYQLSARQRNALKRAASSSIQNERRKSAMLPYEAAKHGCLYIDGFNLIITLEVALSGSPIIKGSDGVLRDLAGLRGTYSLIAQTDKALDLIGRCFRELSVPEAVFYLDSPVSNSGRLKKSILEHAKNWETPVQVVLVPNADVMFYGMERVVSGDSIVLDRCLSWFNLSLKIIGDYIKDAWIIDFDSTSMRIQSPKNI